MGLGFLEKVNLGLYGGPWASTAGPRASDKLTSVLPFQKPMQSDLGKRIPWPEKFGNVMTDPLGVTSVCAKQTFLTGFIPAFPKLIWAQNPLSHRTGAVNRTGIEGTCWAPAGEAKGPKLSIWRPGSAFASIQVHDLGEPHCLSVLQFPSKK